MALTFNINLGDLFKDIASLLKFGVTTILEQRQRNIQTINDLFEEYMSVLNAGFTVSTHIDSHSTYPGKVYWYTNKATNTAHCSVTNEDNPDLDLNKIYTEEEIHEEISVTMTQVEFLIRNREDINKDVFDQFKRAFGAFIWKRIHYTNGGNEITDDDDENELSVLYPLPFSLITVKQKQNDQCQKWERQAGQMVKYMCSPTNMVLGIYKPRVAQWPSDIRSDIELLCLIPIRRGPVQGNTFLYTADGRYRYSQKNVRFILRESDRCCYITKRRTGELVVA